MCPPVFLLNIMKKILISLLILAGAFFASNALASEHDEVVCSQSYGQPVVCGVKTPEEEHVVIKAGLADHPEYLGLILIGASVALYVFSRRLSEVN